CAESALKSVIGGLNNTYFVGNAPMAQMVVEPKEDLPHFKVGVYISSFFHVLTIMEFVLSLLKNCFLFAAFLTIVFFQRFFFKSQVIGTSKLQIGECKDFVWVTKDEVMEYFPEQASFFNKMIIS
ncbi:hypothetical protein BHE74_00058337, partial [Ensete ventricosum]